MVRGQWRDPGASTETLRVYALPWVVERELSDRTRESYLGLLERQVLPSLGDVDPTLITPPRVRTWRHGPVGLRYWCQHGGQGLPLLRAVMNAAVDDEVIDRNPCRIKGAGVEPTPERPVIGVEAVIALADAVPERYRTLILLATFGCLRWGELMGLRKSDIDLNERRLASSALSLRLAASWSSRSQRPQLVSGPIALPRSLMPEIARHLDRFCGGRT